MSFAIVFPGQNSQSLKMEDELKHLEIVQNVFNTAHRVLGADFLQMLQEDTPDNINNTINTQPLMLTAGYAAYQVLLARHKKLPKVMAGHSLGEWTALVSAESIGFEDALELVRLRAIAMQEAVPVGVGAMMAVLGLDDTIVIEVCRQISEETKQVVAPVNFNSIGQVVIAGNMQAVELAGEQLKNSGARKVQKLSVSVPSHCSLMLPASERLKLALDSIDVAVPKIPVLHNVDASIANTAVAIKDKLVKQLYSPVLWTKVIQTISNSDKMGVTDIIECGPGKVLTGLNKRINSQIVSYNLHKEADFLLESLT